MEEAVSQWISKASDIVWGLPMIVLLMGTHLFLTLRLGFIQRFIPRGIKLSIRPDKDAAGDVSHFGALTAALAATIGTGNIFGVAAAVVAGGPGAIFWMWMTGVLGIATKYGEAVLAVKYRVQRSDGTFAGGPMYVLEHGLKMKPLAILFAIFTAIAAFGIGNMVQANAISDIVQEIAGESHANTAAYATGIVLAFGAGLVILGGVKSIARVCAFLVPIMAVIYCLGCLAIILHHFGEIPAALGTILTSAFTGSAAVGGAIGITVKEAVRYGVARGIFSNESGMGSAPILAAAARTTNSVRQGIISATGTFWDTVVICAMTGLAIVLAGDWKNPDLDRAALAKATFYDLPGIGPVILTFGLATFVFSTILGWSYYGEKAVQYLFGDKVITLYRVFWVVAIYFGAVLSANPVWDFSDVMNACMAFPNLVALLLLSHVIAKETRTHMGDLTGKSPD